MPEQLSEQAREDLAGALSLVGKLVLATGLGEDYLFIVNKVELLLPYSFPDEPRQVRLTGVWKRDRDAGIGGWQPLRALYRERTYIVRRQLL